MLASLSRNGAKKINTVRQCSELIRQTAKTVKTGCTFNPVASKSMASLSSNRRLLQVSVKADLYERIRQHCDQIDIPMAIWTRELIKRELASTPPTPTP